MEEIYDVVFEQLEPQEKSYIDAANFIMKSELEISVSIGQARESIENILNLI